MIERRNLLVAGFAGLVGYFFPKKNEVISGDKFPSERFVGWILWWQEADGETRHTFLGKHECSPDQEAMVMQRFARGMLDSVPAIKYVGYYPVSDLMGVPGSAVVLRHPTGEKDNSLRIEFDGKLVSSQKIEEIVNKFQSYKFV